MSVLDSDIAAIVDDPVLRQGVRAVDLVEAFLARIRRIQPDLNALVSITERHALQDAERIDGARAVRKPLPLDGMPLVIKDNIDVGGCITTNGSHAFGDGVARSDAEVVSRLRAAGAILLGKAHLHELAFGVSSDSARGRCINPWDKDRIPGGSSSGSGVALAADLCVGALGTDTGGSVRIPSAANGVVGLRPTVGAISTRGTFPVSQTFDTIGPMARSVRDVEQMFNVMMEYDPLDPWSRRSIVESGFSRAPRTTIGVPREYFFDDVDPEIAAAIDRAVEQLVAFGMQVQEIRIPDAREVCEGYPTMVCAEAFANYRHLLEKEAPFLESTVERLRRGATVSGADFSQATHLMMKWRRSIEEVFAAGVGVILTPTLKMHPHRTIGYAEIRAIDEMTKTTRAWSFAQLPAISIPCGFSKNGLPIGLQLTAPPWCEPVLFEIGKLFQAATTWHRRRPTLTLT
ncbi:MAG TPA: amidase [Lacipirellulaceae bacterium]|nr:amidase [Lacipirellulaceae bacterium]